ncbi:hypothetical protein ILYODFUR_028103 [Ilyodon furcidens]|uniref:Uncharacterized protein n=1 Tax=Ilyodon furcidens TaxID=33524 RepID=A0ABV0TBP7_9TELE
MCCDLRRTGSTHPLPKSNNCSRASEQSFAPRAQRETRVARCPDLCGTVPQFSLLSRCPLNRNNVPHLTGSDSDKSENSLTGAFLKHKDSRAAVIITEPHQLSIKIRISIARHDKPACHDASKRKTEEDDFLVEVISVGYTE